MENFRMTISPVAAKTFPREFLDYFSDHNLIYNEGRKQKSCWNCKLGGVKYESGNMIITRYHCQKCNIPLCRGSRECHTAHHWRRDHPIYRDFPTNIVVVPCHMKGNLRLVSDDPIGTPPDYLGEEHEMAGFRDEFAKHKIVSLTGNKKRLCLICKITRRRTSGGCRVSARHKCGLCDHHRLIRCHGQTSSTAYPTFTIPRAPAPGHTLAYYEDRKERYCVFCKKHKIKTRSGWHPKSLFRCRECDVCLCSGKQGNRNCFLLHSHYPQLS
uniref:PiggyBac transposable element-derived protein 4 C-terminal zinc-finger domain-containing protein n=1 Tax=Magallana gigas TaxID=29159 RepID=A0A8W8N197_MAGGI